jgi:copper homeostasis protein
MNLEICVDSVESAVAAEAGGAQRVELCSGLAEGGITPSTGLLRAVRSRISIGLHVMIRPRGGDFLYSEDELEIMREDIATAGQYGADGVVLGLLTEKGDVDLERTRYLVELARPMQVTFHRALDMSRDLEAALGDAIRAGANRILTSGAAANAMQGRQRIARLVQLAGDQIQIMVAGGVRPENVALIADQTRASHFHAALRKPVPSLMQHQNRTAQLGAPDTDDYVRYVVQAEDVRRLRQAMDAVDCVKS